MQVFTWSVMTLGCWLMFFGTVAAQAEPDPSMDAVVEIVESWGPDQPSLTMESLLEEIGNSWPELRTNLSLVHTSKSRQGSSFSYPRVLSFANDGSFVMTFNGHSDHRAWRDLEMMQFRGDRFEFQRVYFGEEGPEVKPVNERICLGCHGGTDPRPNWEPYDGWSGFYGSSDDPLEGDRFGLHFGMEHDRFAENIDSWRDHERYRFMDGLEDLFQKRGHGAFAERPNVGLTQRLSWLNYQRIARKLSESADYYYFKFAILAGMYSCADLEEYLPDRVRNSFNQTYDEVWDETNQILMDSPNFFTWFNFRKVHRVAGLRYVLENRGESLRGYSTAFSDVPYGYATFQGRLDEYISSALIIRDPELASYRIAFVDVAEDDPLYVRSRPVRPIPLDFEEFLRPICEPLKRASLTRLAELRQ